MEEAAGKSKREERGSWVSLRELAIEWSARRQTVRRALERAGIRPVFLSDARNGTLRYSREDVLWFLGKCRQR
jgi:hypothetical protein